MVGQKRKGSYDVTWEKGTVPHNKQREEKVFPHTHKNSMRETKVLRVSPDFLVLFFSR